jgi:hypothetical protein
VTIGGTTFVSLRGLSIGGHVHVQGSGDAGLDVGDNTIAGSLLVGNNTIVGSVTLALFVIDFNTVGRNLLVVGNDATNASEPPFVGGNVVTNGNLVCQANVPALLNTEHDGTVDVNTVLSGKKLGQCAAL